MHGKFIHADYYVTILLYYANIKIHTCYYTTILCYNNYSTTTRRLIKEDKTNHHATCPYRLCVTSFLPFNHLRETNAKIQIHLQHSIKHSFTPHHAAPPCLGDIKYRKKEKRTTNVRLWPFYTGLDDPKVHI